MPKCHWVPFKVGLLVGGRLLQIDLSLLSRVLRLVQRYLSTTEDSVFVVTELWMIPGSFNRFKSYRKKVNDILEKYEPEYIFHNHAFEWAFGDNEEVHPTGIEIIRFDSEKIAREAMAKLGKKEIKDMEAEVFSRVRCYFSRYAAPDGLKD